MDPARAPADVANETTPETDFASIFEKHFDYVWFTLRRLGVAERDLEDVTHDVFVRVYQHLGQYDHERAANP